MLCRFVGLCVSCSKTRRSTPANSLPDIHDIRASHSLSASSQDWAARSLNVEVLLSSKHSSLPGTVRRTASLLLNVGCDSRGLVEKEVISFPALAPVSWSAAVLAPRPSPAPLRSRGCRGCHPLCAWMPSVCQDVPIGRFDSQFNFDMS